MKKYIFSRGLESGSWKHVMVLQLEMQDFLRYQRCANTCLFLRIIPSKKKKSEINAFLSLFPVIKLIVSGMGAMWGILSTQEVLQGIFTKGMWLGYTQAPRDRTAEVEAHCLMNLSKRIPFGPNPQLSPVVSNLLYASKVPLISMAAARTGSSPMQPPN